MSLHTLPKLVVTDIPDNPVEISKVKQLINLDLTYSIVIEYLHKPPIPGFTFDLTVEHLISTHRPDGEEEYDWMKRYFRNLIYTLYRYFTIQGFYVHGRLPYEYARLRPGHRLLLVRNESLL